MNENELKDKLNAYRAEISKKKRGISDILSEVRVHQREANKLRRKRDEGNDLCKKLSQEARELREKRDSLNAEIAKLKKERSKTNAEIKDKSGRIKDSKKKRDKLNRSARGTDESLSTKYDSMLTDLINKDIPLDKEQRLFEAVFKVEERLEAAKEATEFHQDVVSTYEEIKSLDDRADAISAEIRKLADESEKYHLQAVDIYKQVDEVRKEADDYHAKLLEKYDVMNPMRDKITAVNKEIEKIQEEMAPFMGEMDKIKAKREEERLAQRAVEAQEKLKSSKRISFDDLKAIMEGKEPEPESGS